MVVRRRSSSSAARVIVLPSISMSQPLFCAFDQNAAARGFEQREDGAQLMRTARAGEIDGGGEPVGLESGEARDGGAALVARQILVAADSPTRSFPKRAHGRRVQRLAAAEANGEVSRAANLLSEG